MTGIEKKFAILLEYTKVAWDTCAFVSTHAISWENLTEVQQEAAGYLFGREKWEKNVNTKSKKKAKKQKTNQYFQRSPVPEMQEVTTLSREANRILIIIDNDQHFLIHSVTDNSWPTGVLLPHYKNKEHKLGLGT